MTAARLHPLPDPPPGFRYYRTRKEVLQAREMFAYQHMLLRAWEEMSLSGVLALNGVPTVYVRDVKTPLTPKQAAEAHRKFWNQGIATVFVLRDPKEVRVFSSTTKPTDEGRATDADIKDRIVEHLDLAAKASQEAWARRFYVQIGTGSYYSAKDRADKFNPRHGVDAYLLANLTAVRDALLLINDTQPPVAHAFLGRILFTGYLCDRGIVDLSDYFKGKPWKHLHELLNACADPTDLVYNTLFPALKKAFNGSMFDADLAQERDVVTSAHFDVIRAFLRGDDLAKQPGQPSLGFWAYDFKFIPVETISAIYESFLEGEDSQGKHASGAFYTPRLLAEMALDRMLTAPGPLYKKGRRFIDPACGSGIFLVLLFNRLSAEWRKAQRRKPTPQTQADELLERLDTLRGVDKNPTACRIACFSLYLAFLDTFDPPGVRAYKLNTGAKLPDLLRRRDAKRAPDHPVIWEAEFLDVVDELADQYDFVIGNPPWGGRGDDQIVHPFMNRTPDLLRAKGRACLLLPAGVFVGRHDDIQERWLRAVTLESVVQLADYSEMLFQQARSPCCIAVFTRDTPDPAHQEIEYITPKVSRVDLREGLIPVEPHDRKWIPLRDLLAQPTQEGKAMLWKSRLWGTPRDVKLLDYLFSLPRLDAQVDVLSKTHRARHKRWATGQGCKPKKRASDPKGRANKPDPRKLKPLGDWSGEDPFMTAELMAEMAYVPEALCPRLAEHLREKNYLPDLLYSKPPDELFCGPLVLFNQGFSEFIYVDYVVRFQHALQSISGPKEDTASLLLLLGYFRSKLARYIIFHTAANVAGERDKAHLFEVMRLPFFPADSEFAPTNAADILEAVAGKFQELQRATAIGAAALLAELRHPFSGDGPLFAYGRSDKKDNERRSEWFEEQRAQAKALQTKVIDPLIYDYFGLTHQERALVEDTVDLFDESDTPGSLEAARSKPTLEVIACGAGLMPYAEMLVATLAGWSNGRLPISPTAEVDAELGIGVLELSTTGPEREFTSRDVSRNFTHAMDRLLRAGQESAGMFVFRRSGLVLDGPRIYVVKPALRGRWTRTAALNDAAEIRGHIAEARRRARSS
jgi:hypothetical protein